MFTCTHVLASELPRRRGHPSRDAAELEPHQAVYLRTAVLVRELRLTDARSCMSSTKLSPLLSLLESGEHVHACEPNLTVAQPVVTGTPSSRASNPPRRASAEPTRVRVHSQARAHTTSSTPTTLASSPKPSALHRTPSCSPSPSC
jgi:hypothetical protein